MTTETILGGLTPEHVIAVGESQSAGRLVTYIDAVHPLVHVYDGFLVHSRGAGGAALSQAPQAGVPVPTPSPIRDDLGVPVLVFQTETDVFNSNLNARQPDTDTYRLWEVAGTSHFDFYGLSIGMTDTGDGQGAVAMLESMQNPTNQPNPNFTCNSPINTGTGPLRARRRLLQPQPLGGRGRRAAGRTSSPDHRGESRGLRHRCQRQRAGRHPHARRGCTRRHAERSSPGGQSVLLPVRHDGAVHSVPAGRALPEPRTVRVRFGAKRRSPLATRGSSSTRTPRRSNPPPCTPTSGSRAVTAGRRARSEGDPRSRVSPVTRRTRTGSRSPGGWRCTQA